MFELHETFVQIRSISSQSKTIAFSFVAVCVKHPVVMPDSPEACKTMDLSLEAMDHGMEAHLFARP